MRITNNGVQTNNEFVDWHDIKGLNQKGDSLILCLKDGSKRELTGVHHTVAQEAFRVFSQSKALQ
ncbi:MAG: hypothetical protein S4CHLAM81_10090 [Chlamydiales bacterium]|nr:hypothetical protein [Chlamydiales bacterium]MCH9635787.1 hypothetical protein [Chlamydiales bacterium]MCH9704022.1 hypothetical protein [Chlamydiota bacterium]